MSRKLLLVFLLGGVLSRTGYSDNLYRIRLQQQSDADKLKPLYTDVIFQSRNDYLVLVTPEAESGLLNSGLQVELVAADIERDELAIDGRLDRANIERYPLLFEKDNFRLYRVDNQLLRLQTDDARLFAVGKVHPVIEYSPEIRTERAPQPLPEMVFDSLVGAVSRDSLQSYTEALQGFYRRTAGTWSNYASRDWIAEKLRSFGYDSVVIDSFQPVLYSVPEECQNVIAYKIGTTYPDHQIIIGAHRDAVPESPGADDNGSGTAGVLEIARILRGVETDMTFIFILFDAEEEGLFGSWHYAENAFSRGDNIVYMLDMDMLGYYENTNYASLYYGVDDTYSQLWQSVAAPLVGIYGVLSGASAGSDHFPFAQLGYPVTFVEEFVFSRVYHSPDDITAYMNFGYMTKLVGASLVTALTVNATAGPVPALAFAYPEGLPISTEPDSQTTLRVEVTGTYGGALRPGSLQFHYSIDGGAYDSVSTVSVGGDLYEATLPSLECRRRVSYFLSAEEAGGMIYLDPPAPAVYDIISAVQIVSLFEDNFETDKGWSTENLEATSGDWQRGVPVNDPSWTWDPLSDADGSGQCFLTQNTTGNSDVDLGSVRLISPVFDMSKGGDIAYAYYLMLSDESGAVDRILVEISSDGGAGVWVEIACHTTSGGLSWRHNRITEEQLIDFGVTLTSTMRIRFTANDADPQSIVEAGIDALSVIYPSCRLPGCCGLYTAGLTGNTDCDVEGKLNLADITLLIDHVYLSKQELCCLENGNVDGDLEGLINLADITRLIDRIYISHDATSTCL